jgi:hypothetical protein
VAYDPVTETINGDTVTMTGFMSDHHQSRTRGPKRVLETGLRRAPRPRPKIPDLASETRYETTVRSRAGA